MVARCVIHVTSLMLCSPFINALDVSAKVFSAVKDDDAEWELARQRGIKPLKCPQTVQSRMWGIWIDGRNSEEGPNAYGKDYAALVMPALQLIYDTPAERKVDINLFTQIRDKLGEVWRKYRNPYFKDVQPCHKSCLPAAQVDDIMSTVSSYTLLEENEEKSWKVLESLLANYSNTINSKSTVGASLTRIATFMQNLAYLHPLQDHNGRSRLLLLQYVLRQQGIACGTMMFNNNKNVYFETVSEIADNIKEGIQMYNIAFETGFAVNPWASRESTDAFPPHHLHPIQDHQDKFAHDWDAKLKACWADGLMHNLGSQQGTSPLRADVRHA